MPKLSWTQPICDKCWTEKYANRLRIPHRMVRPVKERCSWCGKDTRSGIYARHDPSDVPFPAVKE